MRGFLVPFTLGHGGVPICDGRRWWRTSPPPSAGSGDEGGLTNWAAKLILEKRKEIEKAFADLDSLIDAQPRIDTDPVAPPLA